VRGFQAARSWGGKSSSLDGAEGVGELALTTSFSSPSRISSSVSSTSFIRYVDLPTLWPLTDLAGRAMPLLYCLASHSLPCKPFDLSICKRAYCKVLGDSHTPSSYNCCPSCTAISYHFMSNHLMLSHRGRLKLGNQPCCLCCLSSGVCPGLMIPSS
jgi:hypothetical protein